MQVRVKGKDASLIYKAIHSLSLAIRRSAAFGDPRRRYGGERENIGQAIDD